MFSSGGKSIPDSELRGRLMWLGDEAEQRHSPPFTFISCVSGTNELERATL